MKQIIKWLESQGVTFQHMPQHDRILIVLEAGCTWINGLNEELKYNKTLTIWKNPYKEYLVSEITGYNRGGKVMQSGKQAKVIEYLSGRLSK